MQVYGNSERPNLKTVLFFVTVLVLAFLPVSSFLFFLKNDAFNGYFPPKFFMSESIHAGYLPLWNPYINFGIPQYGDMSGGYWSPITWLIASTMGYTAYALTIEVLLYILIGGMGMYSLCSIWIQDYRVRIIAGIAFMCCGYNIGHLQHFNWISGAAFLPWCLYSYIKLLKYFSLKNVLSTALFFYMLVASAHPGITIGAIYFFIAVLLFYFFNNEQSEKIKTRFKKFTITNGALLLLLLCVSAGMILGYLDILPYFIRGEKISLDASLSNPTNAQSWFSILMPFTTVKNDAFFNTDPTMRNSYFSIALLIFFIAAFFNKKTAWQKFLLTTGLVFALLSAGGIFKSFAYNFLPMIGYVRLNGEFRIFAILCFILLAAIELDKLISGQKQFTGKLKWIYYLLEMILFGFISFGLYKAFHNKDSVVYNMHIILEQHGFASKLKSFIDAISFYDTFWMQGTVQLFILWGIKYCLKSGNFNVLRNIVIADMILASLFNVPFTGVGKASVRDVQAVLNQSPKGIPIPSLKDITQFEAIGVEQEKLVGDWNWYNKQINIKEESAYPVALKNMRRYFETIGTSNTYLDYQKPYLFSTNSSDIINVQAYSPNMISFEVMASADGQVVFKQNYYPHWYYYNSQVKKEVVPYGSNFMSVPVNKGINNITIKFEPTLIKWSMAFSLFAFLGCFIILMTLYVKQPSPLSPPTQQGP